ncbi:MAG: hypothetical protein Q4E66_04790 [Comamonadaceae bacterium]|nr:hypothetical protein [Comamonadaceae bacterium]
MQTAGPVPGRGVWQSWSLRSRFFLAAALALCVTVLMVVLLLQSALTSADQQERVQRYELPAQLQSVAARVQAQLNLATRLQTTDQAEIGRMCEQLNRFLERLRTAFRDVRTSVNAIHANAGSIARGNQDLAQRTETEVAALEHSASSMEELATSVQQNAETAHMASSLSSNATDVARQGGELMTQVVEHMQSIASASQEQARGLSSVTPSTTQMEQVTQQNMALVDEVAAAAAQLEAEVTRLHDLMGAFHLEQNSTLTLALR